MVYLDFAGEDASVGGYVLRTSGAFAAAVVGLADQPLVALRAEVPAGSASGDVRTDGLWASVTCETRDEHWSVGMEAFAVGYDDPLDALGDERGDVVALGFDLEWERTGDLWSVHGDLLIGRDRIVLDTTGALVVDPPSGTWAVGRVGDAALATTDVIPVVTPAGALSAGVAVAGDGTTRVQFEPVQQAPTKPRAAALCRLNPAGVAWVFAALG